MAKPVCKDVFLPVQGKVVHLLGHQYLGQQPSRGNSLVDHLRAHRRLRQGLAAGAGSLAVDVTLQSEHAGRAAGKDR